MKYGYDNEKYLKIQSDRIKERIAQFGNKLYMEFGGKLFDDYHASRVLPGFEPDSKFKMLYTLKDDLEIVIVISAVDIEKNKIRNDLGITYDVDVLRLRDEFLARDFSVNSVVITHYNGQGSADAYRKRLERMGIKVYYHYTIEGYPHNVALIDSDEGFGKNDYVETTRPLVVVTAPGPGSGKMAVCLSQLYQENKRGIKAGYAKFETFPVWSLPLNHPVNIAYEAATADLDDVNMIDPFHLEAYGETAVNYNRDIEIFPVMNALFDDIYGSSPYKSPTDMGVNMIGSCISDDDVCRSKVVTNSVITNVMDNVLRIFSEVIAQFNCDVLILGGKPSSLPVIREILLRYMPVKPSGIVCLKGFSVGSWYPFSQRGGGIADPKTTCVMGATVWLYAERLKKLEAVSINSIYEAVADNT